MPQAAAKLSWEQVAAWRARRHGLKGTRRRLRGAVGLYAPKPAGDAAQRGTATATELAREHPMSRQAVSKHLGVLAEAGLVESEPEGRAVRYSPTPEPMSQAVEWMTAVGRQWDARLAALGRSLER
jgi:DNA-binding transcriptional ArsR family regulator